MVRKAKHLILYQKVCEVAGHFMAAEKKVENKTKNGSGLSLSKATPPPDRPHLLKSSITSQQNHELKVSCSNTQACQGHFRFKLQQHLYLQQSMLYKLNVVKA